MLAMPPLAQTISIALSAPDRIAYPEVIALDKEGGEIYS